MHAYVHVHVYMWRMYIHNYAMELNNIIVNVEVWSINLNIICIVTVYIIIIMQLMYVSHCAYTNSYIIIIINIILKSANLLVLADAFYFLQSFAEFIFCKF